MENNTLVSCIVPSYKRSDTLVRAIKSILNQTYKNIEVLVVDDNIPGDEFSIALKKVVEDFNNDYRVILVTQEKHINGAEARNAGVRASHGDYIAFLDDDDEWFPDKIEKQMDFMLSHPEFDGVAGGATLWENGREISHISKKRICEEKLLLNVLIRRVDLTTCTFLCKKSAFISIGGFDTNLVRSQDLQLFADFLFHYRIYPFSGIPTAKIYIESNINRLDSKKLIDNKEAFFRSISDVLDSFSKRTLIRIKSAHYYEIALVAFREGKASIGIKYLLKGIRSPKSLIDLIIRYLNR